MAGAGVAEVADGVSAAGGVAVTPESATDGTAATTESVIVGAAGSSSA